MSNEYVRSALFVPGNRPERFNKALASGCDAVIVDLEDAVSPADKSVARDCLAMFLDQYPDVRVLVRVNAPGSDEHEADLQLCRQAPGVIAIVLPKAESAVQVAYVAQSAKPVWPIIESALGVLSIGPIAACAGVRRLTFGALDLALDLGLSPGSPAAQTVFDQTRFALLLHSRANDLQSPLDSVYPAFEDDTGLNAAMRRGRDMGMGGALCIHPRQVPVIHKALAPTPEEKAWAQRVVNAAAGGAAAFNVDGQMIDAPVLSRARRLLSQA